MHTERIKQIAGELLERTRELQALISETQSQSPASPVTPTRPAQPQADATGTVIRVRPGDNVAAAFDQLQLTGGTLLARPGRYQGVNFIARKRPPNAPVVVIRSDTENLPAEGQRITREYEGGIAVFASATTDSTFVTQNGARHVGFVGVGFGPTPHVERTLVAIGNDKRAMRTVEDTPQGFTFDRVLMWGMDQRGQHLGIRANGGDITATGCAFYDFVEPGRDSQAVCGWNGSHHHVWDNCLFEAASENVLYGGSDPASAEMNPRDVLFQRCTFSKDLRWNRWPNNGSIKALFEIKNISGLKVDACIFERNWRDSWPSAVAIVLKVVNQENTAPFACCQDVEIVDTIVRDCGTVLQVVGWGDGWSSANPDARLTQRMRNVAIRNLLAYNLNTSPEFMGEAKGLPCANPPDGLSLDHVTMVGNRHSFHNFWNHGDQPRGSELRWTNSIMHDGAYGVLASPPYARNVSPNPPTCTQGLEALRQCGYDRVDFRGNVVAASGGKPGNWGADNACIPEADVLASYDRQKRITPGSPVARHAKTTDGAAPGADIDRLLARIGAVI